MSPSLIVFLTNFVVIFGVIYKFSLKNNEIKKNGRFYATLLLLSLAVSFIQIIWIKSVGMEFEIVHIVGFIVIAMIELNIIGPIFITGSKNKINKKNINTLVVIINVIIFIILYLFVL